MSIEAKVVAQAATKIAGQGSKAGLSSAPIDGKSPFLEVLESYGLQADGSNVGLGKDDILKALGNGPSVSPADNAIAANDIHFDAANFQQLNPTQPTGKIANMLEMANKAHLRMDDIMSIATQSESLSNKDLIFLQAAMTKTVMTAELSSKALQTAQQAVNSMINRGAS